MRVAADTHAIVWFLHSSSDLSGPARQALREAQDGEGIAVSVAVLFDLWYVTQTTKAFTPADLDRLRSVLTDPSLAIVLTPADADLFQAWQAIDRRVIADPWDRMIVAGAVTLGLPLVTKDRQIQASGVISTIW